MSTSVVSHPGTEPNMTGWMGIWLVEPAPLTGTAGDFEWPIAPFSSSRDVRRESPVARSLDPLVVDELCAPVTGYMLQVAWILRAIFGSAGSLNDVRTGCRTEVRLTGWVPEHTVGEPTQSWRTTAVREVTAAPTASPAAELRRLSGITVAELAQVFGVSRPAYQAWIRGVQPRPRHRDHLLAALALVREAYARLGATYAVRDWLRAPVRSGGSRPLDLLTRKEFDVLRGYLLRAAGGRSAVRPLEPVQRNLPKLSRAELRDALRAIDSPVWPGEEDSDSL